MRYEATAVGDRLVALKEARHLNVVPESRVRRFPLGFLTGSEGALIVWLVVLLGRPMLLSAQTLHYAKSPDVKTGQKAYNGGFHSSPRTPRSGAHTARRGFPAAGHSPGLY